MTPRDFETDDDWEQIDSTVQVDGDYYIIQGDISRPRIEELSDSEPETPRKQITASNKNKSTRRQKSERSKSPRDGNNGSEDNEDKKAGKRESNQLTLPHRSRALSQQRGTSTTHSSTTSSTRHKSHSPRPSTQRSSPNTNNTRPPPTWQSFSPFPPQPLQRQPPPANTTGHTYGAIYAAGQATVLMGNIGPDNGNWNANARSHSYGPVFTTGGARVYVGDVTSEEAARIFQRR